MNIQASHKMSQVMRNYHEKRAEVEAAVSRIRSHVVPAARSRDTGGAGHEEHSNLWVSDYMLVSSRSWLEI